MFRTFLPRQNGAAAVKTPHPLLRRLDGSNAFSARDKDVIMALEANARIFAPQTDVVLEGDAPAHLHVLLDGFACRCKMVDGRRRQIVSFLVPGDCCDGHFFMLDVMDHSILTLSEARIALIPRDMVHVILESHPAIMLAFFQAALINESMSREWLANMGRRSPGRRIGHLLCEMLVRLKAVGLAEGDKFALPITQADLGDTMGLSTVHVNRTLQDLKEKKLIQSKRGMFEILDVSRLEAYSDFNPGYLHLLGRSNTGG